jgi:hypothetical protein
MRRAAAASGNGALHVPQIQSATASFAFEGPEVVAVASPDQSGSIERRAARGGTWSR